MTADRWWVRLAARWLARVDGVSGQLKLGFQGMAGISAALGVIKYYGFGGYAPAFLAIALGVGLVYTYLYTEGGVWNQVARDKVDMSDNYSGPTMLMGARIEARQLAHLGYVLQNGHGKTVDEIHEEMLDLTEREWAELRDGVDIAEIER